MSEFWKDAAELEKAVVKMYEIAKEDKEVFEKGKLGKIIVYKYHDPDAQVWFDTRDDKFSYGTGEPPAPFDVRISCSGDDAHRAWSNKLNTVMAMTRKKLKVEGSITDLMKGAGLLKNFAIAYNKALKEMGKESIILK